MVWVKLPTGGMVNMDRVALIVASPLYAEGKKHRVTGYIQSRGPGLVLGEFPSMDAALTFIDRLSVTVTVIEALEESLRSPDAV